MAWWGRHVFLFVWSSKLLFRSPNFRQDFTRKNEFKVPPNYNSLRFTLLWKIICQMTKLQHCFQVVFFNSKSILEKLYSTKLNVGYNGGIDGNNNNNTRKFKMRVPPSATHYTSFIFNTIKLHPDNKFIKLSVNLIWVKLG